MLPPAGAVDEHGHNRPERAPGLVAHANAFQTNPYTGLSENWSHGRDRQTPGAGKECTL
jgi:hypothetical protein